MRFRVADDPDIDFSDDDEGLPPPPRMTLTSQALLKPDAEEREVTRKEGTEYLSPLNTDPWIYRIAVGALSLVVVGSPVIYYLLAAAGKPMPEALVGLVSAAVTALVLLVKKKE